MKDAMRREMPAGGAEMGQRSPRVLADKDESKISLPGAGSRARSGSLPSILAAAFDPDHWRPSFGVQGQDVSSHQGDVDWATQWNKGSRFAYVKASEGNYYLNEHFAQQYDGSRNVGMIRGSYHFAIPNWSSGADQARYFIANGGAWRADGSTLPPVLDFEFNPYEGRTIGGFYFGNTCYDMTPSQLISWAQDFGNTVRSMIGRYPVIYTNTSWWNYCTGNPGGFGDYPLWVARYPQSPTDDAGPLPSSWSTYSFWQYSSEGPFAGDSNVWNGDWESLRRFADGGPVPVPSDFSRRLVAPGDFNGDGKADLIQRRSDGELWFYPGDGAGHYLAGRRIGSGWQIYDRVLGVGDYNGDGRNDLVARKLDGSLWFYAGTGTVSGTSEGYSQVVRIGDYGWDAFDTLLGVRDFDGDKKADLLARKPDGKLYLYSGTGTGATGSPRQIDYGWDIFNQLIAIQDFNGDGTSDLAGRHPDGTLYLYSNSGRGTLVNPRLIGTGWGVYGEILGVGDSNGDAMADFVGIQSDGAVYFYAGTAMRDQGYKPARKIGEYGWEAFDTLIGTRDFNGDNRADLLARKPDGTLWFYPGTGTGAYGSPRKIGEYGWEAFNQLSGVGDFNGDGKNDLLARKPDGTLWLYPGTGKVDALNTGYGVPKRIGDYGWEVFNLVQGVGDLNNDGKNDILARKPDGSLWLYRGTGTVSSTSSGYLGAVKVGNYGWDAFDQLLGPGDFNSDGKADLLARKPDGTLWFYPGDGSGTPGAARRIGTGWNIFDLIIGGANLDADSFPDLVARKPDGSLWAYSGTGMQPNEGYLARALAAVL